MAICAHEDPAAGVPLPAAALPLPCHQMVASGVGAGVGAGLGPDVGAGVGGRVAAVGPPVGAGVGVAVGVRVGPGVGGCRAAQLYTVHDRLPWIHLEGEGVERVEFCRGCQMSDAGCTRRGVQQARHRSAVTVTVTATFSRSVKVLPLVATNLFAQQRYCGGSRHSVPS